VPVEAGLTVPTGRVQPESTAEFRQVDLALALGLSHSHKLFVDVFGTRKLKYARNYDVILIFHFLFTALYNLVYTFLKV
jgi:hypothetical protein